MATTFVVKVREVMTALLSALKTATVPVEVTT